MNPIFFPWKLGNGEKPQFPKLALLLLVRVYFLLVKDFAEFTDVLRVVVRSRPHQSVKRNSIGSCYLYLCGPNQVFS